MKLVIGLLYPDLMNIYGDLGNVIALQRRCRWRGIDVRVKNISIGDGLKAGEVDLYFFGGGQDQSQVEVAKDLQKKAKVLKAEVERGVPLLAICGGYQLLGQYYQPDKGERLEGVGIFDAYTKAGDKRMIGNLLIEDAWGDQIVGFENHSGQTYPSNSAKPLGRVIKGFGNNGQDKTEGSIYKNAIGCYMHGSLLPKNPKFTDWLILQALKLKYPDLGLKPLKKLDDTLEDQAREQIISQITGK